MIWLALVLLAPTAVLLADKDSFLPLSESSFSDMRCVPYAYGDFNADKFVDVFCVSNEGRQVEIWLARGENKEPLFEQFKVFSLVNNETSIIKSIVPGDFNGDSIMDLLITYTNTDPKKLSCSLFLGNKQSKYTNDLEAEINLGLVLDDQPFVADFNGDGKLDVLVIPSGDTKPLFFSFELNGTLDNHTGLEFQSKDSLMIGYAQSISDIDGDLSADLCLTTKSATTGEMLFQVLGLNSVSNQYEFKEEYVPPEPSSSSRFIYGQSLFADFDSDGIIEHLLPVCKDSKCLKSAIYVRKNAKWIELPIKFDSFGFVPPQDINEFWWYSSSIRVTAGDYNLNGYVDLLAVLRNNNKTTSPRKSGSLEQNAILLENIPYTNSSTTVDEFTRTFSIDTKISHLFAHDNVVQASFFDLYDNGYLDILIVLKDSSSEEKDAYKLIALENKYEDDVYFLKVMVIPGRCSVNRCPYQSLPYGLNFPGAMIKMETTSYEYERVVLYAAQLSQSSHMALQLPYVIFGLGSTPNFVELLTVSIQSVTTNKNIRGFAKEWHQIIPNSQLVISPEPRYYPNNWKLQLFITPSKNILMTGVALGVTMICLIVMIGVLQFKERKMDEKERKLESQRFHFDGL